MSRSVTFWINHVAERFAAAGLVFGHGTHSATEEAAWLVQHALGVSFVELERLSLQPVAPSRAAEIERLASQRIATRRPLAYLVKHAFLGPHRFFVDERVLVPRSFLAEHLRKRRLPWPQADASVSRVLDLCTGSGCLAICAAHRFPGASVVASDVSRDALDVARINVREHAVGGRVRVVESDLFARLAGERFDLILSNPPYVTERSMRALPPEYLAEPRLGLAGGADGLDLVRQIVARAPAHLRPGGWLVLEIGGNSRAMRRAFGHRALRWLSDDTVCALQLHD